MALAGSDAAGAGQALTWAATKCDVDPGSGAIRVTDSLYNHDQLRSLIDIAGNTIHRDVVAQVMSALKTGEHPSLKARIDEAWEVIDEGYVSPYAKLKYTWGAGKLPRMWHEFLEQVELLDAAGKPNAKEIEHHIAKLKQAAEVLDPLSRRITGSVCDLFSVLFVTENGSVGKLDAVMFEASETVEKLRQILAFVKDRPTNASAEQIASLKRLSGDVTKSGQVMAKLVPFVDMSSSAYSTFTDLQKLDETHGKDPFVYASFLGDAFATFGGALELAPPPYDMVGKMINVAGTALSSAASLLDHFFGGEHDPIEEQKRDLLDETHPESARGPGDGARIEALASPAARGNLQAAAQAGLGQDQINTLLRQAPKLFEQKDAMKGLAAIQSYLEARYGLHKMSFAAFIDVARRHLTNDGLGNLMAYWSVATPTGVPPSVDAFFVEGRRERGAWVAPVFARDQLARPPAPQGG